MKYYDRKFNFLKHSPRKRQEKYAWESDVTTRRLRIWLLHHNTKKFQSAICDAILLCNYNQV